MGVVAFAHRPPDHGDLEVGRAMKLRICCSFCALLLGCATPRSSATPPIPTQPDPSLACLDALVGDERFSNIRNKVQLETAKQQAFEYVYVIDNWTGSITSCWEYYCEKSPITVMDRPLGDFMAPVEKTDEERPTRRGGFRPLVEPPKAEGGPRKPAPPALK